ncbi:MAG: YlxR family protein [Clostridia bacterium]|nr:YlxR family protein [Clostridia bacterium]
MNEKIKKTPMRMCVGCRQMHEKKTLVRIVRDADGALHMDLKGKASGRGAYICKNTECLGRALKTKAIERALGVALTDEVFKNLAEEIK